MVLPVTASPNYNLRLSTAMLCRSMAVIFLRLRLFQGHIPQKSLRSTSYLFHMLSIHIFRGAGLTEFFYCSGFRHPPQYRLHGCRTDIGENLADLSL